MSERLQLSASGLDLRIGQPDLRLLPRDLLRQAAAHRLAQPETDILQYGPPQGSLPLRRLLAGFLTRGYGVDVDPAHLVTTFGASHGLDLVLGRYTAPGDVVLVEEPTYFHALGILKARGLDVVGVPVDDDGLRMDDLEAALRAHRPKLLYTVPVHHNPTGVTLSAPRRRRLAELAQAHDLLIVADEVYQLLTYEGAPPPPMRSFAPDRTVSISSFSKLLAPGLRFGWIEGSPAHVEALGRCGVLQSGGGATPLLSAVLESVLELGLLEPYVERLRAVYGARRRVLGAALDAAGLRFTSPTGGFFIWAHLDPAGPDAEAIRLRAVEAGTGWLPGHRASVTGEQRHAARLCFAYFDEAELETAVARLRAVIAG